MTDHVWPIHLYMDTIYRRRRKHNLPSPSVGVVKTVQLIRKGFLMEKVKEVRRM